MPSSANLILSHAGQKATATVAYYETVEKNKKFTVYKVMVNAGGRSWFLFRRYNEFHKLYDMLKKQFPSLAIKFPGKKIFGNNFDPNFIKSRREALDDFVQKLITEENFFTHPDVRIFLHLDSEHVLEEPANGDSESCDELLDEKDDKPVDLGPTEKPHAKPSDFEFLKVIGKGSFGKVLLARHRSEQTIFAVKVLQKRTIIKRNETRHIMAERNVLLKNLNHPFLVGLQYSFQTPDKLYFVLDYVNGGELFFHLQKERHFSEPRSRFYAAEIGSALGYLHSQNIVYRDLKPENILLDFEGHIVLTDFGLCKEGVEGTKTTTTFCGTPEYLAPEVLRKEPYDRCVDWWCLGAVLYEMLFGLPPFYSRDTSEMYDNILNKPLRLRNTISTSTKSLLEGLLEKDKRSRLGSGIQDFEDVKSHDFFKPIRWEDLNKKLIPPPYHPNLSGALDLKNIDPEFTKEAVPSSLDQSVNGTSHISASIRDAENAFLGFSYAPPLEIHK